MKDKKPTISDIIHDSKYSIELFTRKEIDDLEADLYLNEKGKPYFKGVPGDTDRPAKPEEVVRQLYARKLNREYGYPWERIEIEHTVVFGSDYKSNRADIVVLDPDKKEAYIIVEVKKPNRSDGREQLKSYTNAKGSPIGVWINGSEKLILHREDPNTYHNIDNIPTVDQTLADVIGAPWTYETLERENKLVKENTTLKKIILDIEDIVLAHAGVDAFDEVFKLIYAKLYDEWRGANDPKYLLQFRVHGDNQVDLKRKISHLFEEAKNKWRGAFDMGEEFKLSPSQLAVCVSFLQDVKLFNCDLRVIDDAFEYLAVQVGKGNKGQYFTPRHVIDMCVKMLNPRQKPPYEFMIDTAAGSCGFTVHTIFHVWGHKFRAKGPTSKEIEFASEYVYGIDFDSRMVKIAKSLNLIAGDGKTHVYQMDSLNPRSWNLGDNHPLLDRLRYYPDDFEKNKYNRENLNEFAFDVLMTNPPFAGDIKDTRIIHYYDISKKANGKYPSKVGRDILFIERNLSFLRPGGRMAIVLPQGRFNNTTDESIRRFIADRARILAVVGLHGNTFKPHTGTKTSVLFLQKWNDDPKAGPLCPKVKDYPIFFAVSEEGGKDNSGEYIYEKDDKGEMILDEQKHPVVHHDLDEIADAFIDFAKTEKMSFWK